MVQEISEKPAMYKVTFRLPEDIYRAIQQTAQEEIRPINSQTIVLLREALASREREQKTRIE